MDQAFVRNSARRRLFSLVLALMGLCVTQRAVDGAEETGDIQFNRDIRPILAENCFQCHGPDAGTREADLRLDTQAGLFGESASGEMAIVPGRADQSELFRRITASEDYERMPPDDSNKSLTDGEIELVRNWIAQGAQWQGHWAFFPPQRTKPPSIDGDAWSRNPLDRFILARLASEGLASSAAADRITLIRRLSFDLTGLPPRLEEVQAFVDDDRPFAYERLVDRLLASPHYGERMAIHWLDLVRFADSGGYHSDTEHSISPYRDYVIEAFNGNLPFDCFTREQLAGDLLPNPTLQQRVASGYNRLNKTTEEGGAQAGEYLVKYAADRVRTTAGTWLGLTLGCAECHDHKYDPVSTKDFYSFAAFFADVKERGVYSRGGREPELPVPTETQAAHVARIEAEIAKLQQSLTTGGNDPSEEAIAAVPTQIDELKGKRSAIEKQMTRTMVTVSVDPREIRILPRGNWLDHSGDVVSPALPTYFGGTDEASEDEAEEATVEIEQIQIDEKSVEGEAVEEVAEPRLTRLDLADWFTSPDNPLTARVFVNRLWELFYGTGLSKQLDDLGTQGEWPTHPELLDWLAVEFRESGWDVKHMVRLLVTSSTYRQSSFTSESLGRIDPLNRFYARQSRWRLDAEMIRDNALAVSGLLTDRVGGRSVKPYQPAGYWSHLNFPKRKWAHDTGPNQYRRGLYTHWQRTFLHPSLLAFDAPSREECTAQRTVSNTPKAALTLLNDPTYVEGARVFAVRILTEGGSEARNRIRWAWQEAVSREPEDREIELLLSLLEANRNVYEQDADSARGLLEVGLSPTPPEFDAVEIAAWTSVARALFNLNEFITRN